MKNTPKKNEAAPAPSMPPPELVSLSLDDIMPSLLNPRKHFDAERLAELKESFRAHGFDGSISHLLVRPIEYRKLAPDVTNGWNIVCRFPGGEWSPVLATLPLAFQWAGNAASGMVLLTEEDADLAIAELPRYEIICGERRWAAASELKLATVPAAIAPLADAQAREVQLIENLQREALTPLEEAEGVCALLELRDAAGEALHTPQTVAASLGRSVRHITRCRQLRRLRGTAVGEAVEAGTLSARHGELIASLPTAELREEVASKALKGRHGAGPMSTRELEEFIRHDYMTELRGTGFDQADATLVALTLDDATGERTGGGACGDCPFNSANIGTEEKETRADGKKSGGIPMCMNLGCHRRKLRAAYERWGATQRGEVVPYDERDEYLDHSGRRLPWNCGLVEVEDRPAEHMLKESAKNPPPWKKLIAGRDVPEKVFKDDYGDVHRCAPKALAIAAAKANGHRIFSDDEEEDQKQQLEREKRREAFTAELRKDPANAALSADEAAAEFERLERERAAARLQKDRQKEEHERLLRKRIDRAEGRALFAAVKSAKKPALEMVWGLLIEPLLNLATTSDDLPEMLHVFGIRCESEDWTEREKALQDAVNAAPAEHLPAVALMLAMSGLAFGTAEAWKKRACKTFGVDVKAVVKAEKEAIAAEEKASALAREIDAGMKWVTRREKAGEFEWDGLAAVNPDICEVAMPAEVKADVSLFAARGKKGWRAGVKIASKKHGDFEVPLDDGATDYGTRELAILPHLTAAQKHFEKAKVPAAVERLGAYIARMTTPQEETSPRAKKKK